MRAEYVVAVRMRMLMVVAIFRTKQERSGSIAMRPAAFDDNANDFRRVLLLVIFHIGAVGAVRFAQNQTRRGTVRNFIKCTVQVAGVFLKIGACSWFSFTEHNCGPQFR